MALNFAPYEQRSSRSQGELESLQSDVLNAQYEQTLTDLPLNSISRINALGKAKRSSFRVGADLARQRITDAGLQGRLSVPDEGIAEEALNILIERKTQEVKRQTVLSRAPSGIGNSAARF